MGTKARSLFEKDGGCHSIWLYQYMDNFFRKTSRRFFLLVLFFSGTLFFSRCKYDESHIKIERFEYLEEVPTGETYLIHGYKKRFDKQINQFVDRYVCDSLFPLLEFDNSKYLYFFKHSKNTNRENFQIHRKHKIIRAWSNDILFSYWFYNINGAIVPKTKYYHAVGGKEDPPPQSFRCD